MKTILTKEHYSHLVEVKQALQAVMSLERDFYYDVLMWEDDNVEQMKVYKEREFNLKAQLEYIKESLEYTREKLSHEQLKEYRDYHKNK
jgi:hypothetical protein